MNVQTLTDSLKFITEGGMVSIAVALALLLMSIGSWYLMVVKSIQIRRLRSGSKAFLVHFWNASSLSEGLANGLKQAQNPFAQLAIQGAKAAAHHRRHAAHRLLDACSHEEFIARALRRSIAEENARLETGLTLLASVGSVAPFIGLFGTVWGIYHALGSIAVGGQATVDKVAGPVGEALIMTAFGLAVAIPAVLAYNTLVRDNRLLIGEVESFAHDLHTYLTTGVPLETGEPIDKSFDFGLTEIVEQRSGSKRAAHAEVLS